jgi:hypothetical protein
MQVEILKDTTAERVFITIEDGKMKINKEKVELKAGDIFDASVGTNIRMPKDQSLSLKMQDNSSLNKIPVANVKISGSPPKAKKRGCGGCGKKR